MYSLKIWNKSITMSMWVGPYLNRTRAFHSGSKNLPSETTLILGPGENWMGTNILYDFILNYCSF